MNKDPYRLEKMFNLNKLDLLLMSVLPNTIEVNSNGPHGSCGPSNDIIFRVLFPIYDNELIPIDVKFMLMGVKEGEKGPGGSIIAMDLFNDVQLDKNQTSKLSDWLFSSSTMQNEVSAWMYDNLAKQLEDALSE
jgi:hypothetical protein